MNNQNISPLDLEFKENTLSRYTLIEDYKTIKAGDHVRYTKNKYKEEGRQCRYVIIKEIDENNNFICNSYKERYPNWTVNPTHKFKEFRFYRRVETPGKCIRCNGNIIGSYLICYNCKVAAESTKE